MYVQRNTEARTCNRWGSSKAISITCFECVFVVLVIQRVMRMRHTVICDLPGFTVLFHPIS